MKYVLVYHPTMLKLNTKLIRKEMAKRNIKQADIARAWRVSPQAIHQVFQRKPITFATKFGKLLKMDALSLIE